MYILVLQWSLQLNDSHCVILGSLHYITFIISILTPFFSRFPHFVYSFVLHSYINTPPSRPSSGLRPTPQILHPKRILFHLFTSIQRRPFRLILEQPHRFDILHFTLYLLLAFINLYYPPTLLTDIKYLHLPYQS